MESLSYQLFIPLLWFGVCGLLYWIVVTRGAEPSIGQKELDAFLEGTDIKLDDGHKAVCALMFRRYRHSTSTAYLLLWFALALLMTVICFVVYAMMIEHLSSFFSGVFSLREDRPDVDLYNFLTSITLRVALVALTLYVIAVLLRLYRYQLRVADFYRSRLDGIIIRNALVNTPYSENQIDVENWMNLTNPPFDVGNQQFPLDQILKIIEAAKTSK